ncbi:MAG: C10 family peptidase [Bacteroidales bacterium]|nr:C10 family peptidase [Bacteroidales bacterium]
MKFYRIFVLLLLIPALASAKTLTKDKITTLGICAFHQKAQAICPEACTYSLKSCQFLKSDGIIDLAVLHFDSGFLIFSAEDAVFPVLAYSFTDDIDLDNLAPGASLFLSQYRQEIAAARRTHAAPGEQVRNAWDELLHPAKDAADEVTIAPLLHSSWNQNRFYNDLCPQDENAPSGYDGKVPNGCVAIAMSQIMYYYRYPESGAGSHTNYTDYGNFHVNFAQQHYNYDAMCDRLSFYNNEVAKLIFHCGTAINMVYGSDGSGAYSQDVPEAMSSYFKYSTDSYHSSKHNYSYGAWCNMLKAELEALRPVYYSGYSEEGGHAFICDGYNSDNYFHFNFGWGGSSNGYYITQSTDSDDNEVGGYGNWQSAIFNLHPLDNAYPSYCNERLLTASNGTLEDGSGNKNYLDNSFCTFAIADKQQYSVNVTLKQFSTQEGHDFLRFWNGHPSQDSLLLELSGTITNEISQSFNTDSLYITFETDDSVTAEGWYLTFESLRNGISCGAHIFHNETSGVISDRSDEDNNYQNNQSCSWSFRFSDSKTVIFNFEELNISPEDHLDFYDVRTYPNVLIASYSGNSLPEPLIYNSTRLRVSFIADNYLNADGFKINWAVEGTGIEGFDIPVTLYPNPAAETVRLSFTHPLDHCEVFVSNIIGEIKFSQTYNNASDLNIPVSELANGIYILSVNSESGTWHKKFMVKH